MDIKQVAEIIHGVNKTYCEAIGDNSQPDWEDAPDWQKESAVNGVIFHLENPDATPENSHESWLAEKEADGWVVGEVKDAEAKTHPCMVPYEDLPVEQQVKDHLFRHLAHTLSAIPVIPADYDMASGVGVDGAGNVIPRQQGKFRAPRIVTGKQVVFNLLLYG